MTPSELKSAQASALAAYNTWLEGQPYIHVGLVSRGVAIMVETLQEVVPFKNLHTILEGFSLAFRLAQLINQWGAEDPQGFLENALAILQEEAKTAKENPSK